ncbi:MAG: Eco57I restriction-modification methylase domain-containing protein [Acidobacteria bacterium]|nr:Eco57I restriction-modification methylase domain-containing protein [Acidobacteriota bacterium]
MFDTADALASGRAAARSFALALPSSRRLGAARAFCAFMVAAHWQRVVPGRVHTPLRDLFQPIRFPELTPALRDKARSLGQLAAELAPLEAAYYFGRVYTSMLPDHYRARLGVYYTPPEPARRLIDQATSAGVDWRTCRVVDPACGGGAFLAPVALRMLDDLRGASPTAIVDSVSARLRGFELDPFAAWLSQVCLDAVMWRVCHEARRRMPVLVTVCDSLRVDDQVRPFDLVIGNPPYCRTTLTPGLRLRYRRSLYGHANLYGLFTDLGIRLASENGVIAYVTPTSFLAGEYFKNLRRLLIEEARPASIDFVTARKGVFEDVLQETLLATYRKGKTSTRVSIAAIAPHGSGPLAVTHVGEVAVCDARGGPWLLPRSRGQRKMIAVLGRMRHRLRDWGYAVSTGPLVWNRHKRQFKDGPGQGLYPVVWAEAITANGAFSFRADKKNHRPYLQPRKGEEWLLVREPSVLVQRTTAKEQTRRLVAATLPDAFVRKHGAVIVENHVNMVRPLGMLKLVEPEIVAAYLNSACADEAFRCISGSVAVSAYELESLPLPDPDLLGALTALVVAGADRAAMDFECARLCGLADG